MVDLSIFLLFKRKLCLKDIKKTQSLRKNEEDTYGAPVFAPDYSATTLEAKMCTKSNEHSKCFRFLWLIRY
jgi:hypothetical protein